MSIFNLFKKNKSATSFAISAELAVRSGDFNKGFKMYSKAIELDPLSPSLYLSRAEVSWLIEDVKFGIQSDNKRDFLRLQDYNKAIELLESNSDQIKRYNQLFPKKLPKAFFDRAFQKHLLGDNDGARSDGLKSKELGHPKEELAKLPIDLN